MSNHGYILKNIERRTIHLYIPESEQLGPIGLILRDDLNSITIFGRDAASELAIENGGTAAYKKVGEVDVPQKIIDLINSYKKYKEAEESAKPILKEILASNE